MLFLTNSKDDGDENDEIFELFSFFIHSVSIVRKLRGKLFFFLRSDAFMTILNFKRVSQGEMGT